MKIWGDLGREITDKLFLETHYLWGYSPTMREAATAFMQADKHLYNGIHLCTIMDRFNEYGLIEPNQIVNITSFVDQTVTTDITIITCEEINVQDVEVQNKAKLTIDAKEVTIDGEFEIEDGSEFEIK